MSFQQSDVDVEWPEVDVESLDVDVDWCALVLVLIIEELKIVLD